MEAAPVDGTLRLGKLIYPYHGSASTGLLYEKFGPAAQRIAEEAHKLVTRRQP